MAAQAQISVGLDLSRKTYIAHEAISGKLTIVNRAGRDLIFGNVNGANWLKFSIKDSRGHLISPISRPKSPPPVVIASGQTHTMNVVINQAYPMDQIGTYRVQAIVSFPQISRVFPSPISSVQIANANPFWSQIVGVPAGQPGAGTYRVFELINYYHGARQKALYFRLKNNETSRVLSCYSLGDYLAIRPPTYKIDRNSLLHIIHMVAPQQYYYTSIDFGGNVVDRQKYYEKKGSRPSLYTNDFGEVVLRGGVTEEEHNTTYEKREFRLLSERPPGLPKI